MIVRRHCQCQIIVWIGNWRTFRYPEPYLGIIVIVNYLMQPEDENIGPCSTLETGIMTKEHP